MHELSVSKETLRQWMMEEGLWKAKAKKERKIFQRRTRRSRFGELLQGDGSHHDWFEGRGEKCVVLIFVDDATSRITAGGFFPGETTEGYEEVLKQHLAAYGRPLGLYTDKHSVFRVNQTGVIKGEAETHFGRVLRELDIKLICAHSPQAKGRVERANGTLQDRLVKEMRLRGISQIDEANEFLPEFIEKYNQKFGKEPMEKEDAHRPLQDPEKLERILAKKTKRKLSKNLTFQYGNELYQIETDSPNRIRKTHVEIIDRRHNPVIVEIEGKKYSYKKWKDVAYRRPPVLDAKELEHSWPTLKRRKPGKHHPWK